MDLLVKLVIFTIQLGLVFGETCYHMANGNEYCSGRCKGSSQYQYCETDTPLEIGEIVGIVIASLIFVAIVIGVTFAICGCKKSVGTNTRAVNPTNTRAFTGNHSYQQGRIISEPSAPPPEYSMAMNGNYSLPNSAFPPPPPIYPYATNRLVFGDICYNYLYSPYISYCSGYCSGYYGNQYCETSLTVGGIVGIVIGSLVFLGIVIGVIVAICVACTKSAGTTGRVVYPVNTGYAVVHSSAQGQGIFHTAPSAPPYQYSTMMYGAYPQTSSAFAPPPPPVYTSGLNGMDGNQPQMPPKY